MFLVPIKLRPSKFSFYLILITFLISTKKLVNIVERTEEQSTIVELTKYFNNSTLEKKVYNGII